MFRGLEVKYEIIGEFHVSCSNLLIHKFLAMFGTSIQCLHEVKF